MIRSDEEKKLQEMRSRFSLSSSDPESASKKLKSSNDDDSEDLCDLEPVRDLYEGSKRIPDTNCVVDGFRLKKSSKYVYFLSHYHSDHYTGITKEFPHKIYCSELTSALVVKFLGVRSDLLVVLPMEKEVVVGDVAVTLMDANHCPGAVLLLFRNLKKNNELTLHCGDFRYHEKMKQYPCLKNMKPRMITHLYLDTTFNDAKFCFPPQEKAIESIVEVCKSHLKNHKTPLFLFGTYSIGKEKVFSAVAKELNVKVLNLFFIC